MVGYGTNNIDRFMLKVIASPNPPYKTKIISIGYGRTLEVGDNLYYEIL
jgi:hypothetical protein